MSDYYYPSTVSNYFTCNHFPCLLYYKEVMGGKQTNKMSPAPQGCLPASPLLLLLTRLVVLSVSSFVMRPETPVLDDRLSPKILSSKPAGKLKSG